MSKKVKVISKIKYQGLKFYHLLGSIFNVFIFMLFVLFFIANARYKTNVYLIGTTFKNVSVSTVMLISFFLGVVFSFFITVAQIRKKKKKLAMKNRQRKQG